MTTYRKTLAIFIVCAGAMTIVGLRADAGRLQATSDAVAHAKLGRTNRKAARGQHFAVLPESAANELRRYFEKGVIGETSWQPTGADIDSLEANLAKISTLMPNGQRDGRRIRSPERYYRQYLPIAVRGQRRIYINAFCDDPPPADWRDRLHIVIDGGSCYWQAFYDPATKRFSNLMINGVA